MEIVHCKPVASKDAPNQFICEIPSRLGDGIIRADHFSSGLKLLYLDLSLAHPVSLKYETAGWDSGISFNLAGYSEVCSTEHQQILQARPDTSVHFAYPYPQILSENITTSRRVKVSLVFDSKTLLDFANEDEEPFLPFLQGLQKQIPVSGQEKIAPEIQRALKQLINCPFTGKTRTIFMEGKAMEIFAHKLDELKTKGEGHSHKHRINASDVERIHTAAKLLVRDPLNPPDLLELATRIGMGRSTFYKHFKLVFGHSPMDHLRYHRLQAARSMLEEKKHNVSEVAYAVGFNNLSYFTRAFNAEFGVQPHQLI